MAEKLTDRTTAITADDLDWIHVVDVSDTTDSPQGTSKKISKANLFSGTGGGGTNDAADLTTGVLADARVQQSNVTQHQAALSISTTQVTGFDEAAQDAVGAMFSGNTENGIVVTYDDGTNKVNFDVNDPTITLAGDLSGSAVMNNLGNVTISAQVANDSHTHDSRYYTEAESDARFLGISAKSADSNLLDGLDSSQFLRKDISQTLTGNLTATNNITAGGNIFGGEVLGLSGAFPQIDFNNGVDSRLLYRSGNSLIWRFDGVSDSTIWHSGANNTTSGTCTATAFFESSDATLKTKVKPLSKTFKTFELKEFKGVKRYGVIAQEVEIVNPELVKTNDEGLKSVNYIDLLCKTVAEQENKIEEQEARIERLELIVEQLLEDKKNG